MNFVLFKILFTTTHIAVRIRNAVPQVAQQTQAHSATTPYNAATIKIRRYLSSWKTEAIKDIAYRTQPHQQSPARPS